MSRRAWFLAPVACLLFALSGDLARSGAEIAEPQRDYGSTMAGSQPSDKLVTDGDFQTQAAPGAPVYYLNWYTVNSGGVNKVDGTTYDLGLSVGQAAVGFVSGSQYRLGMGFWYGATGSGCPIAVSGDANNSGNISTADILVVVNFVFKAGPAPQPCAANGDVNCSGAVSTADILVLVNFVFKAGPAPCNICTIIPSQWSCP